MSRKGLIVLLISFLPMLTGGCSKDNSYVFLYGNAQNENDPRSVSMKFFKEELEKRTEGRITVQNYFGGMLGTEREMADSVAIGALQGTRGGMYEDASIKFNIMQLPFLLESWDQALRLVRSPWMAQVAQEGRAKGFHIPAVGVSQGFRAHGSNGHAIRTLQDFEGLKIRVPGSQEVYHQMEVALGANPQGIAQAETYSALKTGVVDGTTAPPSDLWDRRQYETLKWITIDRHSTGPDPLMVNLKWYEKLPDDLKLIFDEVAKEAMAYSDKLYMEMEEEIIAKLRENTEIIYLDSATIAGMKTKTKPVYDFFVDRGDFSWEDINAALAVAEGDEQ
ncbi:MAG: TRAP transporter substrate-binding protein [Candidatus Hydrogenedentota bacterium]